MTVKLTVLKEDARQKDGVEYLTVSGLEAGPTPLLQVLDYGLRADESQHKGKLLGKSLELQVESIRAIFAGRPQLTGRILKVS